MGEPPPPPRAYRVPPQPGPDYEWSKAIGTRRRTVNISGTTATGRTPVSWCVLGGAVYRGRQYYTGHWEGHRGDVHHYHGWDQSRQRDESWRSQGGRPQDTRGSYER